MTLDAFDVMRLVAHHTGVAPGGMCRLSQNRPEAHARHLCWYLMHTSLGMRQADIGHWFGVDRRAVAYGIARVEDRREDEAFDLRLQAIEAELEGTE